MVLAGLSFSLRATEAGPELLGRLQIEEVGLCLICREGNPKRVELETRIAKLLREPGICGEGYYAYLSGQLDGLRAQRVEGAKKYRESHPQMQKLEAQIAFVEKTLAQRGGVEVE